MINKASANPITGKKDKITKAELKERIEAKLVTRGIFDPKNASEEQLYQATVYAVKDIMLEYREDFKRRIKAVDGKKVCYLCMEFLVGRALKNDTMNLGIYDELCEVLSDFGSSFEKVYACEVDPGLGNGGLGRLAACFMDSLTA
ncbi:MAG: glycogen/starch/alpha-glucan phosphorylase, partial [Clostridia bacterium]|nr:glycogen/starch/alpha-glucan phosphorylase [Clostridia bacterium]